jgi:MFS family permease
MSLASLLFGILSVLAPLHLSAAGWSAGAIGGIWLAGAALEAVESPWVGRISDRRGPLQPVRGALLGGVLVSVGLATDATPLIYAPFVLAASAVFGALFTPAFALIADGAERAGLAQGMAFGLMNAGWAVGAAVGPALAGAIAGATGDWIPFLIAAVACLATLTLITRHERPGAVYALRRFREV